ncbi:MAG: PD-(D/E)XK nuclease family protein [Bacteroidales bacterium]|jgi:hypothetical protein
MKFRASFSTLNVWASGDWERAIKYYFKLEKFMTPAMADGKQYHEQWETHVNATKTLPVEFGGAALHQPQAEIKKVVELEPWLDLVGVIDCYDSPVIYDWKTGKSSSEHYAGTMQPGVYGVLASFAGMFVDRAIIWHYDQYAKKSDMSQVWLTDKLLEHAHNWIITQSSEFHNYLTENRLYERFLP